MTLLDDLSSKQLRFSTIASSDTEYAQDLKSDSGKPIVWMTGAPADAGSILAIYIPKAHPSFKGEPTGCIRYLFSYARPSYPRPTKRFSRANAKHVAIVHRRVVLDMGVTNSALLKDPLLKVFAKSWFWIGRSKLSALTPVQTRAFWRLVLENEFQQELHLRRQLLAPPLYPTEDLYIPDPSKKYVYDVAISCSGKDREYADELYRCLCAGGMKVYYYRSKQALGESVPTESKNEEEERGQRILKEIREVYGQLALLFIPILSAAYFDSTHGNREWAHSMLRGYEHMVPLRLDNTPSPAMIGQVAYYDVGGKIPKYSLGEIVERVSNRLLLFPAQEWEKRKVDTAFF